MPSFREILTTRQIAFLEDQGVDPESPLGTLREMYTRWIAGAFCDQEFLFDYRDCDAKPGHSSHRLCNPDTCPYLTAPKPNPFNDDGLDADKYPVYQLPTAMIDLTALRQAQQEYQKLRDNG